MQNDAEHQETKLRAGKLNICIIYEETVSITVYIVTVCLCDRLIRSRPGKLTTETQQRFHRVWLFGSL